MGGGIREVGGEQSRSGSFKKLGTGGNRGKMEKAQQVVPLRKGTGTRKVRSPLFHHPHLFWLRFFVKHEMAIFPVKSRLTVYFRDT